MIEFQIKEKTRSLNESFRGDWRQRAAVAKRQRTKAMQACPRWPGGPLLYVRLTRVSPGTLDSDDNLRGALKHIRDGVASRLKVDDASPLVSWLYHQAKGEAEVVVQLWAAGEDAPPLPEGRAVERKRMNLRSPPRTGAKAGRKDYFEACCPIDAPCPDHKREKRAPRPAYSGPTKRRERKVEFNEAMDALYPERRNYVSTRASSADGRVAHFGRCPWPVGGPCTCTPAHADFVPRDLDNVEAAREAEATFAPGPHLACSRCGIQIRAMDGGRCTPCVIAAFKEVAESP